MSSFTAAALTQRQTDLLALGSLGESTGMTQASFFSEFLASSLFGPGLHVVVLNSVLPWRHSAATEVSFLTSAEAFLTAFLPIGNRLCCTWLSLPSLDLLEAAPF